MRPTPRTLDGLMVVLATPIDARRHRPGDEDGGVATLCLAPAALAICRAEPGGAVCLLTCDARWRVIAGTRHGSLEEALRRAEAEHPGTTRTWRPPA